MNKPTQPSALLSNIRNVIQEARHYVSRKVNFAQVVSNWIIGRMIVEDEQAGEHAAEYGKQVIEFLSDNLTKDYGTGYSSTNLWYFRQFYLLFPIHHAVSDDLKIEICHAVSDELRKPQWLKEEIEQSKLKYKLKN